jgi:hypothetical protein
MTPVRAWGTTASHARGRWFETSRAHSRLVRDPARNSIGKEMLNVHVERDTTAPPDLVLDTPRDPSPARRSEIWSNITPKHFTLHDSGADFLDVTEGTFIVGVFWERTRYEWAQPGSVICTVSESNVFKPGSRIELRAQPRGGGGSRVELIVRREFQRGPKGRIAATLNHLGGRRLFRWYLGTALTALEKRGTSTRPDA